MQNEKEQINFKFAKNWKLFLSWYKKEKLLKAPSWLCQKNKISNLFENSVPLIIDWKQLWSDFEKWHKKTKKENQVILWTEQQRQIETLMLEQLKDLNKEIFVLTYTANNEPHIHFEKLTYWDALKMKNKLEGDANGVGGDESIEKINIINLKTII